MNTALTLDAPIVFYTSYEPLSSNYFIYSNSSNY